MDAAALTQAELDSFSLIERICSVFSLLGCVFIIATFCLSSSFHKPINRLVFYASFGNLLTNVATLMARTYVGDVLSPGCQFQALLIQVFMPADALWNLAMAVNVYLTFYYKYDAQKLRKMEIPYVLFCYGVPFILGLALTFVSTEDKGRFYGNAVLWCWTSAKWDIWRIAAFYGPVWIVIVIIFFIYFRCGGEIYRKHRQLNDLNYTSFYEQEPLPMNDVYSSKTTEVSVTTEAAKDQIDLSPLGGRPNSTISTANKPLPNAAYSVTISSAAPGPHDFGHQPRDSYPSDQILPIQSNTQNDPVITSTTTATPGLTSTAGSGQRSKKKGATYAANTAAWSYAKCALLFFTALLVTWIPSSANRVFSVVNPGEVSLPLEYMSAFVLPLQGFWNAVIYIMTSWKACTNIVDDIRYQLGRAPPVQEIAGPFVSTTQGGNMYPGGKPSTFQLSNQHQVNRPEASRGHVRGSDKQSLQSESSTELNLHSRPNTSDNYHSRR